MVAVHIEGLTHPFIFLFDTFFRVSVPINTKKNNFFAFIFTVQYTHFWKRGKIKPCSIWSRKFKKRLIVRWKLQTEPRQNSIQSSGNSISWFKTRNSDFFLYSPSPKGDRHRDRELINWNWIEIERNNVYCAH
jgi:hypothetical protein